MEIFRRLFLKPELEVFPESYSVSELIAELKRDGFTLSQGLKSDIERFGLKSGIVVVQDGVSGMRIDIGDDEIPRLNLYNELRMAKHPLHKLVSQKYKGKQVVLDVSQSLSGDDK